NLATSSTSLEKSRTSVEPREGAAASGASKKVKDKPSASTSFGRKQQEKKHKLPASSAASTVTTRGKISVRGQMEQGLQLLSLKQSGAGNKSAVCCRLLLERIRASVANRMTVVVSGSLRVDGELLGASLRLADLE
ncbi:unnamed protein product, partial [Amoebophrya sp. A120]